MFKDAWMEALVNEGMLELYQWMKWNDAPNEGKVKDVLRKLMGEYSRKHLAEIFASMLDPRTGNT